MTICRFLFLSFCVSVFTLVYRTAINSLQSIYEELYQHNGGAFEKQFNENSLSIPLLYESLTVSIHLDLMSICDSVYTPSEVGYYRLLEQSDLKSAIIINLHIVK